MTNQNLTVISYMHRLEEIGEQQDHIGRFYVALHDQQLIDLEEQLTHNGEGLVLYRPVLDLYNRWKSEMGPDKWAEVWAYNESLADADKNWLVSEAMSALAAAVTN